MWVMAPNGGFYSAVAKPQDPPTVLTVRARNKRDITELAELIADPDVKPYDSRGTDYPWRLKCSPAQWAQIVATWALDVTYGNYKDHVKKVRGGRQASAYGSCWDALLRLEDPQRRRSFRWPDDYPSREPQTALPLLTAPPAGFGRNLDDDGCCVVCTTAFCDDPECLDDFDAMERKRQASQARRAAKRSRRNSGKGKGLR